MAGRSNRTNGYIGGAATLLFGLSCSFANAATVFKPDCDEMSEPPAAKSSPAARLNIQLAEHGLTDSVSDMKDPASDPTEEKVDSPTLAESSDSQLDDSAEDTSTETDATVSVDELPDTSLRLPGVADKDLPRFRRQMYRTDI